MSDFENIEVDIPVEHQQMLIKVFVDGMLRPESREVYHDAVNQGGDVRQALYDAVLNDMIVLALIDQVNELSTTQQQDDQQIQKSTD
jgi:hypothetical protein